MTTGYVFSEVIPLEVEREPSYEGLNICPTSWQTSTQEDLAAEASDRPETRLELLTSNSSIRFVVHFLISSRIRNIGTPKDRKIDKDRQR